MAFLVTHNPIFLSSSYRQTNPDAHRGDEMANPEDWFESESQRELGQIFSGQSKMFDALRDIQRKMDEIVGRQERTLGLISTIQSNPGKIIILFFYHLTNTNVYFDFCFYYPVGMPQQPGSGGGPVPVIDTIRRHEVDSVLANQREIVGAAREIKWVYMTNSLIRKEPLPLTLIIFCRAYVTEIHQRSATIIQNQGKQQQQQQGVGSAQPIGFDNVQNSLNEVKEGLNQIKRDISVTAQRLASQPSCPTSQPCLSTTIFAVFMVIQMIVMIAYFVYR